MPIRFLFISILLISITHGAIYQHSFGGKFKGRTLGGEFGVDIYEPYFSLGADIRKRYAIKEIKRQESDLYLLMLKNAFVPGYISAQIVFYPVLLLTSDLKERHQRLFEEFSFNFNQQNINALEVISSEFTDPIAYSLFLGEIMTFRKQIHNQPPQSGYGLMGYVLTYGPWSSFNNKIIEDNWLEIKWKIRGLKKYEGILRTWNLTAGYHIHQNPLFLDAIVLEVARSNKSQEKKIDLITNNEIKLETSIAPVFDIREIINKQTYGISLGIYYPIGKGMFFIFRCGIRREMIRAQGGGLNRNYEYFLLPSFTF